MTLLVLTLVAPTAIEVREAGDLRHALLELMPNVVTAAPRRCSQLSRSQHREARALSAD